jgi:hypothetical protein
VSAIGTALRAAFSFGAGFSLVIWLATAPLEARSPAARASCSSA